MFSERSDDMAHRWEEAQEAAAVAAQLGPSSHSSASNAEEEPERVVEVHTGNMSQAIIHGASGAHSAGPALPTEQASAAGHHGLTQTGSAHSAAMHGVGRGQAQRGGHEDELPHAAAVLLEQQDSATGSKSGWARDPAHGGAHGVALPSDASDGYQLVGHGRMEHSSVNEADVSGLHKVMSVNDSFLVRYDPGSQGKPVAVSRLVQQHQ